MKKIELDELLKWVTSYNYEEKDIGIGFCHALISVRDEEEDLKYTFDLLDDAEKKAMMCALIDKVGYPCEDYADDFFDPDSPFGFVCSWDEERKGIYFTANFRV